MVSPSVIYEALEMTLAGVGVGGGGGGHPGGIRLQLPSAVGSLTDGAPWWELWPKRIYRATCSLPLHSGSFQYLLCMKQFPGSKVQVAEVVASARGWILWQNKRKWNENENTIVAPLRLLQKYIGVRFYELPSTSIGSDIMKNLPSLSVLEHIYR